MKNSAIRSIFWLAVLGLAACGPRFQARAADAAPPVFVPSFWDPASLPEKPDLSSIERIRFLTEDDHPPFGFLAADGTLMGFDVDLARALCEELKTACTIQVRRFDTIVAALKAGIADAAIASMAITPRALDTVDFTSAYYRTPARFVARQESRIGDVLPETVAGKRIGVERGTAHEAYLRAVFPAAGLQTFAAAAEARAALGSGAVDLVFGDGITLAQWLQSPASKACCAFAGGPFTESRFFGEGAGIAVRKGNGPLRAALDYALARLAVRGVYSDLTLKYFPIGAY